jgi:hypothetical protein
MGRLRRFPGRRFIGTRDDMRVYDCDDEAQFAALSARVDGENLVVRLLLSSFGPDTLAEARYRGFRAATPSR